MNSILYRSLLAILVYGCIFFLTLLLENSLRVEESIPNAQKLTKATVSFDDGEKASVTLPDNWDKTFPDKGGVGHYQFDIHLSTKPDTFWGIYLPKLSMNAEVSVNGHSLGNGGSMVDPIARYWNLPLYFVAPKTVWKQSDNIIEVNIAGYPNGRSGLSPIFIGPHNVLQGYFKDRELVLLLLDMGSFAVNLILGAIILIWAWQTKDSGLLYFGLGALISCITIADSFITDIGLQRLTWRWITHSTLALSIMLFYLFMLKMLHRPVGLFAKVIMTYLVVAMLALQSANDAQLLPWAKWLHLGNLFLILQLIYLCVSAWILRRHSVSLWLGGCMFIVLNFGFADWWPAVINESKSSAYIYYIGPVAFSFAVALGLLARYITALSIEKNYSNNLQTELQKQKILLDQQYQTIAKFKQERAVAKERERIMRELHDGIGGQLMGALALTEEQITTDINASIPFVRKRIRYALDELRLMMDSLDDDAEFDTSLAMLRQRLTPELNNHHIKLIWDVDDPPPIFHGSPVLTLHGLRLIQEAIVNVLKHANATQIEISVGPTHLMIRDNGQGFNVEEKSAGRGLSNIQWRANQLHAKLELTSSPEGTSITLRWP